MLRHYVRWGAQVEGKLCMSDSNLENPQAQDKEQAPAKATPENAPPAPATPENALSPAIATLYRASIAFGIQETTLIWMRYSAFLLINGFLVTVLSKSNGESNFPKVLIIVGALGVFINLIWHILNFAGWYNQCTFYRIASNIIPKYYEYYFDSKYLPTAHFNKEETSKPHGWIYWLAQSIPSVFYLASWLCISDGLLLIKSNENYSCCYLLQWAFGSFFIVTVATYYVEYYKVFKKDNTSELV